MRILGGEEREKKEKIFEKMAEFFQINIRHQNSETTKSVNANKQTKLYLDIPFSKYRKSEIKKKNP